MIETSVMKELNLSNVKVKSFLLKSDLTSKISSQVK